ncbi:hypothetical protein O0I10_001165 [Lichtheimia ornata]|uniref:assimilatory sulfite reductase (NADPH) n=1 Tax=Lichtheimia ornata TaxID=688661 RepID=A0AAD8DIE5_9FUNG|nr:uncharacterized protein O0I10_001165 [Lichtheimia ornata]KAJ8662988.1 hypothetical protein O0I10_001165 [Lichtheimia ornata]
MFASTALIAALVKSKAFPTNNAHAGKPLQLSREAVESVAEQLKSSSTITEDAASTAGSQTTIVDEESALQLQSRIKNAIEVLFRNNENVRLLDANHAVDYVAYGLSDLVFVYPGHAGNYLGHQLKEWQASIRNSQGDLVKVIEMETRAGALQAVQGAIENNTKTASVLTSSQALLSMIPNIHALALARQPVVFHVGAFSVDENLVAYSQVDAVLAARNSGAIVLSSSNVQEAHDMAIAAHLIAKAAGLPVIHYFDGAASDIQKVSLYSYEKLASLSTTTSAANGGDAYAVVESVLGQFGYKAFEYTGAADAETVLVSLGASVASVSHAVQRAAANKNNKVGLVTVRAYRPWSEAGFIASLPSSTRHVVVLEQTDGLFAFNGPLFLDIAAAIRFGSLARQARPRLVTAQASTFGHLGAAHIPLIVKEAESKTFVDLASEEFLQVQNEDVVVEDGAIFWDLEQDGSADAATHIAHLLHQDKKDITLQSARDAYRVGGAVINSRLNQNVDSKSGFIGVHNIALTKEYDILASAGKKATLVVNGPWKHGEEIEGQLTNEFKLALTQLDIQLYTLDAASILEQVGLHRKSSHVIWEAAYLVLTQQQQAKEATKRLASLYYELDPAVAEDDQGNKRELYSLVDEVLESVAKQLVRIELLPPWTILEVSDKVLPTRPIARAVVDEEEAAVDSDAATAVDEGEQELGQVGKWHQAAWQVMFKEAYGTESAVRPDLHENTYLIKLSENKRLTPTTYDRNVFHLEFDTTGSNLKYELGDALGVHGHNDYDDVIAFLEWYGLKGEDVVTVNNTDLGKKETRTIFQLFSQTLDIFGRPSKKFYEALASYATDPKEKEQLLFLVSSEGKEEYKKRVDDTVTYEDLLREFTSAKPPVEALVNMITSIKPRHYSIASSQKMHPNSVHLLVVAVDWVNAAGKKRYGQCTRYLANLRVGSDVTVSIKPSVMKLPPLDEQPVIMAGLGTGMAPFRAFIQERAIAKAAGRKVGPMVLYFGSRYRSMEYLYGEELEAYHADGLLTRMGLAFSRDGKKKVYIQHKMMEDAELLHDYLVTRNGHFYLCGPTWPVPDVKDAVVYGLKNFGGIDEKEAGNLIEEWKEKEKYILEVY